MKKLMAVLFASMICTRNAQAVDWNHQSDEWPLPSHMTTEGDYKRHVNARNWLTFAGTALLMGAVIANKNGVGLNRKASGVPMIYTTRTETTPSGTFFVLVPDQGQLDNQRHLRSRSKGYKQGAIAGALVGVLCLSIAYSLRF